MRNILLESNKGRLLFELDYESLKLNELASKCRSKISDIKLKNNYILRYNNEIVEINKIINRDDKRVALSLLEDRLLPINFKNWLASKQNIVHSVNYNNNDDELECLVEFNENVNSQNS